MRWDNLFDDLEGQLEYGLGAEEVDLKAEEERLRLGRLSIRDRLTSVARAQSKGSEYRIPIRLLSGTVVSLRPATFGKDWLAGDLFDAAGRSSQCVLPLASISGIDLTVQQVEQSLESKMDEAAGTRLVDRISLAFVLRDLCRRRTGIELWLSGSVPSGAMVHGTIDRVGRDHFDLAVHEASESRRAANVTQYRMIPTAAVLLVRV